MPSPLAATVETELGSTSTLAIVFFVVFIVVSLGITYWAARRTHSTSDFYAAGGALTGRQNGLALAGDYMSAASFLGIAGLVALQGFYGLIYSIGFLVGWPIVLFLIAEPLRRLGKYTFADVVAYRLRQRLVRSAAALSTLAVVLFYLIAQMVGAGTLIRLMFGFDYAVSVVLVGLVMMAYVFFGGMIATSWVQIIKAVLLLGGASLLAVLVLVEVGSPISLFADAEARYPNALSPEGVAALAEPFDAISLGIALMFGTAGLPHILMRFYTVPDARTARTSVVYATGFIGFFYLLTFVIGFGAAVLVGREEILSFGPGGNVSALLLSEELGGTPFLGFIAAVAFATILAVVAGLTLSGAAALSHDLWSNVVRGDRETRPGEELRVARAATVLLAVLSIGLGIAFENQNVAFMVGLAFAIAASANLPALLLSIFWRGLTTWGAVSSILTGLVSALVLIYLGPAIWEDPKLLGNEAGSAPFPLSNPALVSMPLAFVVGFVVSLVTREERSEERFAEVQRRVYEGVGDPQPTAGD